MSRGLRAGRQFPDRSKTLAFRIKRDGFPVDIGFDVSGVPVVSPRAAALLRLLAADDIELIPASIPGASGYSVLNIVTRLDCSSERDTVIEITRPDLIGDHRLFRLEKHTQTVIVAEELCKAIIREGMVTGEFFECELKPDR